MFLTRVKSLPPSFFIQLRRGSCSKYTKDWFWHRIPMVKLLKVMFWHSWFPIWGPKYLKTSYNVGILLTMVWRLSVPVGMKSIWAIGFQQDIPLYWMLPWRNVIQHLYYTDIIFDNSRWRNLDRNPCDLVSHACSDPVRMIHACTA